MNKTKRQMVDIRDNLGEVVLGAIVFMRRRIFPREYYVREVEPATLDEVTRNETERWKEERSKQNGIESRLTRPTFDISTCKKLEAQEPHPSDVGERSATMFCK